ncbi:hypothetical protein AAF712_014470 [Marasmius tenuissimus]|uniref:Retrotransposon gag domain-containing protein n=1 Tax=Marasmius tenuissimus TaxID=585030 RepID=A0ABR2ZC75_9AGAR
MQVALHRQELDARREQRKRRMEQKGKGKQLAPEAQQFLDEWKEMKKELEEARDLKCRYEAHHGKKGCGPCSNSHGPSNCGNTDRVQVNSMKDAGPGKTGFPQTLGGKHVSWSSDTKEPDTPLPKYSPDATPAPDYTFHTSTAGPIDPSVFADTEVFVQHTHKFDAPGSGSSRDVPPHMDPDVRSMGVRFSTPRGMRGGRGTARGRGGWFYSNSNTGRSSYVPRKATPYPRNVPPPTPSWRGTLGGPPGDPDEDPAGQEIDEEDPFQPDGPENSDKGKERAEEEQYEEAPEFSMFIDENQLCREISQMAREALQEQSRFTSARSVSPEDRSVREAKEARKDRVATQSKIRMKDPETFDGEKLEAAINVLQRRKRLGYRVAALENWAAFIAELRADFGLRDPLAFAQARVMKMKQEDGESYGDFYNRFAVMATRSGFDETSLRWYLLKALSKPTLERLRGSNIIPADYQTLHRHLRDLDINDHSMMGWTDRWLQRSSRYYAFFIVKDHHYHFHQY